MKTTKIYSVYSEELRAFAQVKAQNKKNALVYLKTIDESITISGISVLKGASNSHQQSVEDAHPELF
jgi:hypothetical protein